jgi:hypothetical protein
MRSRGAAGFVCGALPGLLAPDSTCCPGIAPFDVVLLIAVLLDWF